MGIESQAPKPQGPIPFDRHEQILNDARKEFETYKATHGWAEQVKREQLERLAELDRMAADDPVELGLSWLRNAMQNPTHAARVRSMAASMLRSGNPPVQQQMQPPPVAEQMPGPDTDQGYSPQGLAQLMNWQHQKTLRDAQSAFAKELDPIKQAEAARTQARQAEEQRSYVTKRTTELTERITKLPMAKEHEAAIVEAFAKMPARTEADLVSNMFEAYHQVVTPILEGKATQAAVQTLTDQAKANAARPTATTRGGQVQPKPSRFAERLAARVASEASAR